MRGDFAGAAKEFERAIALKPNYAKAYANLAKCKLEMEQLAEARQLFVKSIHYAEPDDPTRPQLENIIQQIDALQKQGR